MLCRGWRVERRQDNVLCILALRSEHERGNRTLLSSAGGAEVFWKPHFYSNINNKFILFSCSFSLALAVGAGKADGETCV